MHCCIHFILIYFTFALIWFLTFATFLMSDSVVKTSSLFVYSTHIKSVVSPASKLEIAILVVEGKPSDVYLAGGLEDARRDISASSAACHNYVRLIRPVKRFACTACVKTHFYFNHKIKLLFEH